MHNRPKDVVLAAAAKTRKKLLDMGWKPPVQGGNGHGPTEPEKRILQMVPSAVPNFCIKTKIKPGNGIPTHYKIDVAVPHLKLAIEVDGNSHNLYSRKAADERKTNFLQERGWTVLRFKNLEVMTPSLAVVVLADIEFIISKLQDTRATA